MRVSSWCDFCPCSRKWKSTLYVQQMLLLQLKESWYKLSGVSKSLGHWPVLLPVDGLRCLLYRNTVDNLHSQHWLEELFHWIAKAADTSAVQCPQWRCETDAIALAVPTSRHEGALILKVGSGFYFTLGDIVKSATSSLNWGCEGMELHPQGWTESWVLSRLALQQSVWEICILLSAGNPLPRCKFQHVRRWKWKENHAMSPAGGTGTARHTLLSMAAFALNQTGCVFQRGADREGCFWPHTV